MYVLRLLLLLSEHGAGVLMLGHPLLLPEIASALAEVHGLLAVHLLGVWGHLVVPNSLQEVYTIQTVRYSRLGPQIQDKTDHIARVPFTFVSKSVFNNHRREIKPTNQIASIYSSSLIGRYLEQRRLDICCSTVLKFKVSLFPEVKKKGRPECSASIFSLWLGLLVNFCLKSFGRHLFICIGPFSVLLSQKNDFGRFFCFGLKFYYDISVLHMKKNGITDDLEKFHWA